MNLNWSWSAVWRFLQFASLSFVVLASAEIEPHEIVISTRVRLVITSPNFYVFTSIKGITSTVFAYTSTLKGYFILPEPARTKIVCTLAPDNPLAISDDSSSSFSITYRYFVMITRNHRMLPSRFNPVALLASAFCCTVSPLSSYLLDGNVSIMRSCQFPCVLTATGILYKHSCGPTLHVGQQQDYCDCSSCRVIINTTHKHG